MGRPGLTKHRKFVRLERLLGDHLIARGALETIWDACYENGDEYLGDSLDVEAMARWNGEPGKLVSALVSSGFVDEIEERKGEYQVHDLWHHAPDYVRKRRKREAERRSKADPCLPKAVDCPENGDHWPEDGDHWMPEDGQCLVSDQSVSADRRVSPSSQSGVDTPPAPAPAPAPAQETTSTPACAGGAGQQNRPSRKGHRSKIPTVLPDEAKPFLAYAWETFPAVYKAPDGRVRNLRLDRVKLEKLWLAIMGGSMSEMLDGTPATAEELAGAAQLYIHGPHPRVKDGFASEITVFYSISERVDSKNLWVEAVRKIRERRSEGITDPARPWDGEAPLRRAAPRLPPQSVDTSPMIPVPDGFTIPA